MRYLYITIISNCINNKITTLLCLLNSLIRRHYYKIIIINNNKTHSSELPSIRVNENFNNQVYVKKRSLY